MQAFRDYLREASEGGQVLPFTIGESDCINLFDPEERDSINFILSDITDDTSLDPAVIYERVRSVLIGVGYSIPPVSARADMFADTSGEEVFGMTRPQPPDTPKPEVCYLYFAFVQDEDGHYEVLAEIVTPEELEDILNESE